MTLRTPVATVAAFGKRKGKSDKGLLNERPRSRRSVGDGVSSRKETWHVA